MSAGPNGLPRCAPHGHPMPRYEPFTCKAGHEHRTHLCGARAGRTTCGAAETIPPVTDACDEDEDDDDRA